MATIEHPAKTLAPPGLKPERPVFVASSDRRARILRRAGLAAAILAALWLAALGIGMLGLGRLPGVPLPPLGKLDRAKAPSKVEPANASIVSDEAPVRPRASAGVDSSTARTPARPGRGNSAGTGNARRSATNAPTVPATPQPAPLPNTGWARRGLSAPPGQTRRAQPPRGQGQQQAPGQVKKTTTTPVPPPVPPGQQKPPKKA